MSEKINQRKPVPKRPTAVSGKNAAKKADFSLNISKIEEKATYSKDAVRRDTYRGQTQTVNKRSASTGRTKESFERTTGGKNQSRQTGGSSVRSSAGRSSSARSGVNRTRATAGATATGAASAAGKRRAGGQTAEAAANREAPHSNRRRSAVQRRKQEREIRRRRTQRRLGCFGLILILLFCIVFGVSAIKNHMDGAKKQEAKTSETKADKNTSSKKDKNKKKKEENTQEATTQTKTEDQLKELEATIAKADRMAAGYDYDGAINLLKGIEGYDSNEDMTKRIAEWEAAKKNLVEFRAGDVTHIFYHTLVVDPELAFECEPSIAEGFQEWMTTVPEFEKITQAMYDNGYVLCSLYDFFEESYDENGKPHFKEKGVFLPQGKKPFVLSLDDLSYYHTYTRHGMASRLIIGEDGKVTCEYTERDGSVSVGSYDCVPLLREFMEEHPDGAYHEARGTIALTGYNGLFGYRTDMSYVTRENLDKDKVEWLDAHPEFDHDHEVAEAKKIAEALKAEGWDFASHTWGHIRIGNSNMERLQRDTEKWLKNVKPIIGETECIIFAHGQDLSPYDEYDTSTNKKYKYLNSKGFHIYLNVDSHQKTMAVHDEYVHGGRRNLDGYRLWSDGHGKSDWTSDLFVASEMIDPRRKDVPTPKE